MDTQPITVNGNKSFRDGKFSPTNSMWGDCPKFAAIQDPSLASWVREDFTTYTAADWTITEQGAAGTVAQTDVAGGGILITTDALDNDSEELQKKGEAWRLLSGKRLWFEALVQINEITQSDMVIALGITDNTFIDGCDDWVGFMKPDAAATVDWHVLESTNESTGTLPDSMVADTDMRLGFKYWGEEGLGSIAFYVNGIYRAICTTNIPDDQELCVTWGYQNGEAGAATAMFKGYEVFQLR